MKTEVDAVMLFVAELTGSFKKNKSMKTMQDKITCGQQDYVESKLHDLDLNDEEDRKDLHENIWLERLYKELDEYFRLPTGSVLERQLALDTEAYRSSDEYHWSVPIECDASASMLQYIGILLNDRRLMDITNVIGDELKDPWTVKGLTRNQVKKAATPLLYGSSQTCTSLWKKNKIKYKLKDVEKFNKELSEGPYGVANLFKELIINNVIPKPTMRIDIWGEKFDIECNKFRKVGDHTQAYKIWDSIDKTYNVVIHTDTKKVPDLEQFRRYFLTLLVHHLDSRVADKVIDKVMEKYGWGIPIHDALLVSPAAATDVRKWYAEELEAIHRDRKVILKKFFKSIGITSATAQIDMLKSKIVPFEGELKVNPMALK